MAINYPIVFKVDKKGLDQAEAGLKNFAKVAAASAAAATAALAGVATVSVKEFAKFDAALNKSTAIMGDLSDALRDDMEATAREVAKTTTFSAEQAAESYFFLASAGLDAAASIKAMPTVAKFAQAGMFDMALATDLLTDAQSALGLSIRDDAVANMENMIRVSDVLVKANTLANATVEQFSSSLTNKAGAALRALGKDVEEGVAVLAAFADQGIKGEEAGTQLSIVLRDLTTKAIKNKEEFEALGLSVFDSNGEMRNLGDIVANLEQVLGGMSDETQKATLLQAGFSDKSLASLQALLGTSEAIKTYEQNLRLASGTTGEIADKQLESFSAQLDLAKSRLVDVGISIGSALAPALLDMTDQLMPIVDDLAPQFVAFFENLKPAIISLAELLPVLLNAFSALIPVITAIGTLIGEVVVPAFVALSTWILDNIPTVATFTGVLGGLLLAMNAVAIATKIWSGILTVTIGLMYVNPWVLLAAAIAAIAAGIVYLATKTTFFQDTWKATTKFVGEQWNAFGELFTKIGTAIGSFFGTLGKNIADAWNETTAGLISGIEKVGPIFKSVWEGLKGFFRGYVNFYISLWEGFTNGVIGGLNGIIRAANSIKINIPSWIPGLGGKSFGINIPLIPQLNIPRLAEGGIVMPQPGGVLANLAEAGKPEAVIPLDRMGAMGQKNTYNITVNAGMGTDGNRVGQMIVDEILKFERTSGRVFARA